MAKRENVLVCVTKPDCDKGFAFDNKKSRHAFNVISNHVNSPINKIKDIFV